MAEMIEYLAVRPDMECPAEVWWAWLDVAAPQLAACLRKNNGAVVSADVLRELEAGPDYDDGPDFAPVALLVYGADEPGYQEVVAGKHGVFEELG